MIQWWWLLIVSIVFGGLGVYFGLRWTTAVFKTGLTDVNSPILKMLDEYIDLETRKDAEVYAKGAELYDAKSKCLLGCGHEIAEMFRRSEERKVEHG
jgi:hypothetical protein